MFVCMRSSLFILDFPVQNNWLPTYVHQQWCCFDDHVLYCEVGLASELYSSFVILIGSSSLRDFVIGISNYLHVQLSITFPTNRLQY